MVPLSDPLPTIPVYFFFSATLKLWMCRCTQLWGQICELPWLLLHRNHCETQGPPRPWLLRKGIVGNVQRKWRNTWMGRFVASKAFNVITVWLCRTFSMSSSERGFYRFYQVDCQLLTMKYLLDPIMHSISKNCQCEENINSETATSRTAFYYLFTSPVSQSIFWVFTTRHIYI